jgi:hypothetical protein
VLPAGRPGAGPRGTLVTAAATGACRPSSRLALGEVLGSPPRRAGFAVAAAAVTLLYTILFPFDDTQRFGLANWHYLNAGLLAWSAVLGVAMALVLSVQAYAIRRVAAARVRSGAAGGAAFAVSLLSSFLCCTPVIPTLLAFVGMSGAGLYTATGSLQHFFATSQTWLLAGSLALLAASGWWGLRKVARAACLSGECGTGDACRPGPGAARGQNRAAAGRLAAPAGPAEDRPGSPRSYQAESMTEEERVSR